MTQKSIAFCALLVSVLFNFAFATPSPVKDETPPPVSTTSTPLLHANLYENVDGIEDDYLRGAMCLCTGLANFSKGLSVVCPLASTALVGIAAIPELVGPTTKSVLTGLAIAANVGSVLFVGLESYARSAREARKDELIKNLQEHGRNVSAASFTTA